MKYKIKIKDIQPQSYSISNKFPGKCFIGVSLSNPFFQGKHIAKTLKWIDDNFEHCQIIIADHLHRFNEYTFKGKHGAEAELECKQMGEHIFAKLQSLIASLTSGKFSIHHWLHYSNTEAFIKNRETLEDYFKSNTQFANSILNSCQEFINKQKNRGYHIFVSDAEALDKSKNYLLEEMTVFNNLTRDGYKVQIYPGSQLMVLKELVNNQFPDINLALKDSIYIDLTIKKIR